MNWSVDHYTFSEIVELYRRRQLISLSILMFDLHLLFITSSLFLDVSNAIILPNRIGAAFAQSSVKTRHFNIYNMWQVCCKDVTVSL